MNSQGAGGKFTLFEKENAGIILPKAPKGTKYYLAAKFYTTRALNMEAVCRTFKLQWWCSDGFRIRNLTDHKVLFVFEDEQEVNQIVVGQPWSFDKHLVCVQKYEKSTPALRRQCFGCKFMTSHSITCPKKWLRLFV